MPQQTSPGPGNSGGDGRVRVRKRAGAATRLPSSDERVSIPIQSALEGLGAAAHICSLYETRRECAGVLKAFLEVGIARGEKCVCVISSGSEKWFQKALLAAGPRISQAVRAESIEVTTLERAYFTHNDRPMQCALDFWRHTGEQAAACGYSGLRGILQADRALAGHPLFARWIEHENGLTELLAESGGTMLCLYNRSRQPAELIRDAFRAHAVVTHSGGIGKNVFHVPPEEYIAPDKARREVHRMLLSLAAPPEPTVRPAPDGPREQEPVGSLEAGLAPTSRTITLGQLMASIAHEVNQPIAALIASANAALRWLSWPEPQIDKAREGLIRIVRDGNRASEIVVRIRALVRRTSVRRNSLSLNSVVTEVIDLLKRELRRNSIVVRTNLAEPLPAVHGDRVQIQQVLLNLIMNAIEAMSGVTARPRRLAIATATDGAGVSVSVEDCGVGLDERVLERIFEPFYSNKPQGMGIGLAISRFIIEAHGGQLWAARNRGAGATFQFRLPSSAAEPE
jgi:signal transduction histidine kinase